MSETAKKLREMSIWLLANDIDTKMPEGMIDPYVGADEIEALTARVAELQERLEVDPSHPYDGIACRDETIRQQDLRVARLEARVKALEEALEKLTTRLYEDLDGGRKLRRAEVNKARAALTPAQQEQAA